MSYGRHGSKEKKAPVLRAPQGYTRLKAKVGPYNVYMVEGGHHAGQYAVLTARPPTDFSRIAYVDDFKYFDNLDDADEWLKNLRQSSSVKALYLTAWYVTTVLGATVEVTWDPAAEMWIEVSPSPERKHQKGTLTLMNDETMQEVARIAKAYAIAKKVQQDAEAEWKEFVEKAPRLKPPVFEEGAADGQ